jgi:hypothetical protein
MITAIADTSFVVAIANRQDSQHQSCLDVYDRQDEIVLPQSTLTEICYITARMSGNRGVRGFLQDLLESKYLLEPLSQQDIIRTAALLEQYADARPDCVDLTIVAVAERLNITRVLTFDRRDFSIIRPSQTTHLELLPEPTAS